MDSISHNQTWTLIELHLGKRPITIRCVYKVKNDSMGRPSKYKARLVARGNKKKESLHFQETFALVIKWNTIKTMIALATHCSWKMSQMDVKITILNSDFKEEVYVKQPIGFEKSNNENLVCKFNKTLYGLC
jgi:ATP-binding cassette subfamily B (MDR/TAP) protein 1